MKKKILRSKTSKIIGGVCGGLAEYFDIDVVLIRTMFIVGFLLYGSSVLAYIVLWIMIPSSPKQVLHSSRGIYD